MLLFKWTPLMIISLMMICISTLSFHLNLFFYKSTILELNLFFFTGTNVAIPFILDKMSLLFSMSVLLISSAVYSFSWSYMKEDKHVSRFHWLVFFFITSMMMLIFSPNIVFLILGWDGLGVTSFLLVIYFHSNKSYNAGMITALSNRIGDCLILISMTMVLSSNPLNFFFFNNWYDSKIMIVGVFLFLASMTKSAQIPFSAWLPAAMAAPTPVSSLVHSSTLVTAGVYLMIRFDKNLNPKLAKILFLIGCLTMTMASISAFFESDMKKIIALSTLSQLGLMMTGIGLQQTLLSFFHLLTHAYFKAMMFMAVGSMIHLNSSVQDFRMTGMSQNNLGPSISIIMVANMSLMGLPYLGGFYSKDLILENFLIFQTSTAETLLMLFSVSFTTIYSIRFLILTVWTSMKSSPLSWSKDNDYKTNFGMLMLWPLAWSGGAFLGWMIFPNPIPVMHTKWKIIILMMIFISMIMSIISFNSQKHKNVNMISSSLGNMWSLYPASSKMTKILNFSELYYMKMDQKWTSIYPFLWIFTKKMNPQLMASNVSYKNISIMILIISILTLLSN